jgi:hypothetical protein
MIKENKKTSKELDFLEQDLIMLLDNIKKVKEFQKEGVGQKYRLGQSHVVGELKHRMVCVKRRMTSLNAISTWDLWDYVKN